eukprot:363828-Chlamydomonas_euryale.AAC.8
MSSRGRDLGRVTPWCGEDVGGGETMAVGEGRIADRTSARLGCSDVSVRRKVSAGRKVSVRRKVSARRQVSAWRPSRHGESTSGVEGVGGIRVSVHVGAVVVYQVQLQQVLNYSNNTGGLTAGELIAAEAAEAAAVAEKAFAKIFSRVQRAPAALHDSAQTRSPEPKLNPPTQPKSSSVPAACTPSRGGPHAQCPPARAATSASRPAWPRAPSPGRCAHGGRPAAEHGSQKDGCSEGSQGLLGRVLVEPPRRVLDKLLLRSFWPGRWQWLNANQTESPLAARLCPLPLPPTRPAEKHAGTLLAQKCGTDHALGRCPARTAAVPFDPGPAHGEVWAPLPHTPPPNCHPTVSMRPRQARLVVVEARHGRPHPGGSAPASRAARPPPLACAPPHPGGTGRTPARARDRRAWRCAGKVWRWKCVTV